MSNERAVSITFKESTKHLRVLCDVISFDQICTTVTQLFGIRFFILKYYDDEKYLVSVKSYDELQEKFSLFKRLDSPVAFLVSEVSPSNAVKFPFIHYNIKQKKTLNLALVATESNSDFAIKYFDTLADRKQKGNDLKCKYYESIPTLIEKDFIPKCSFFDNLQVIKSENQRYLFEKRYHTKYFLEQLAKQLKLSAEETQSLKVFILCMTNTGDIHYYYLPSTEDISIVNVYNMYSDLDCMLYLLPTK
jgi:hypothetical protein